MWLLLAFCGPVLWAASTHIDKYLVDRFFKTSDVGVLLVFTALIGVVALPPILAFVDVTQIGAKGIAVITIAGMLYMGAMYLYLGALQGEEASVVAPLFQAAPIFTYVLAFFLLGERLTPIQLIGGAAIICGALIVSWTPGRGFQFKRRMVLLMLAATLAVAIASVIFKLFAVRDEFWTTTFWMFVGEAIVGLAFLLFASRRAEFLGMFRQNPGAVIGINAANELINLGGGLAARFASILGPVSIVQAIGGTTTFFVFGFGVVLSLIAPSLGHEDLSRRSLLQKGVAALLVACGVVLVGGR
jgi:drug/metabolite transporter (DMT)-like permease